jgi:hypothetical protein
MIAPSTIAWFGIGCALALGSLELGYQLAALWRLP